MTVTSTSSTWTPQTLNAALKLAEFGHKSGVATEIEEGTTSLPESPLLSPPLLSSDPSDSSFLFISHAPAALCRAALDNYTSHHNCTQPKALSSPRALNRCSGIYRPDARH